MSKEITLTGLWAVLKESAGAFMKDKIPKLSASLAYYTIFSLGPMLMVIIFLAKQFYGAEAVEGTLYGEIKDLVGDSAALQIQEIIKNVAVSGTDFSAIIGFITLLIGATTVFAEIQDSINTIWRLKVKTDKGILKMLWTRLISFSLVVSLGFLLLVSLLIDGLVESLMSRLQEMFPEITIVLLYVLNILITFLIISTLFAIIFKVLPDAVIRWKDVIAGALFTALLFMVGKFAISFYIGNSDIGNAYGTAGSLVVLLLWVYYSSIILYFGAEFTKFFALKFGSNITPDEYAVTVQMVKVESAKETLQENHEDEKVTEKDLETSKNKTQTSHNT